MMRVVALPIQLAKLCGSEIHNGNQTNKQKPMNIIASNPDAKRAKRLESIAKAARANAIEVVTAQNI